MESVKLKIHPATRAGNRSGSKIRRKACQSVAPRSCAASTRLSLNDAKRVRSVRTINGIPSVVCAIKRGIKPRSILNVIKQIKNAIPITISGNIVSVYIELSKIACPRKL